MTHQEQNKTGLAILQWAISEGDDAIRRECQNLSWPNRNNTKDNEIHIGG